ncbi:hypothetical protein MVEN_01004900 [Mycena venus]|uniref:Uncharacterized protein n=1 Tax=Mycena venus TaxID=2733690 RepID=A0A8H6YCN5_9AGAR|nr:hypothetical protein MVEN_01004900 [Mycena venus]
MNDSSSLNTQPVATRERRRTKGSWVIKDVFTTSKYKPDAFSVPRYKTVQAVADDGSEGEEFDFTEVDLLVTSSAKSKGKQRATTPEPDGQRAKRRKVTHDFNFLETSLPLAVQTITPSSPPESAFAVPSSDLLKYIHHFACNYYSDRGQLFSESRTYRRGVTAKKRAKSAAKEKFPAEDANSDDEQRADPEAEAEAEADPPPKTKPEHRRDMYKTMDGSALLAIGMLLQEHIARILTSRIPDGWEQGALDESESEESHEREEDDPDEDGDEQLEDKSGEDSDSDERSDGEDEGGREDDEDVQDTEGRGSVDVQSDEYETD